MANYDEPIEMPRDILSKVHGPAREADRIIGEALKPPPCPPMPPDLPEKIMGVGYKDLTKVTPENCPHDDVLGGKCVDCGCWITLEGEQTRESEKGGEG